MFRPYQRGRGKHTSYLYRKCATPISYESFKYYGEEINVFVPSMEFNRPICNEDKILNFLCLSWSKYDKIF